MAKFPAASVRHLHCYASDHRPILLMFDLNGESVRWKQKPFHFEEMWLADRGCGDMVRKAWEAWPKGQLMYRVVAKIKKCKRMLHSWSKDHFGSVKDQIKKKKGGDHNMVVQFRRELNVLLDKENRMWFQRSRALWLVEGDRNTKFFHGVATQRKIRNFIKWDLG